MNGFIKRIAILLFLLVVAGGIWYQSGRQPEPKKPAVLTHECYVWQRTWNDDLRDSIRQAKADLKGFTVLAAEMDVRAGREKRQVMPVDYSFLAGLSKPVGLTIRINSYSGPFESESETTGYIIQTIQSVLADAKAKDFIPAEIQIDYDCAESKLAGYRLWIRKLKQAFPAYPITITALPSWMKRRQFRKLVQSCDGYVLQVHSLERPKTIDDEVILCDPQRAIQWTRQADRLGVPFRLALPTYGYLVAYDGQGQFTGLSAEGAMPGWSQDTQIKTVLSDPEKISVMIQEIRMISPKNLTGVIWFRLPVPSDQLNWQWHTLQCIIREQTLTEKVEAVCEWPESNLAEIYLVNSGDVDVADALTVRVEFEGDCLAADGVLGYSVAEDKDGRILIHSENLLPIQRLRSQEKQKIAWCRFNTETEVKASVQRDLQ